MREIVLINITGEDRPGLTAAITGVLAQGGVNILDIGQAVIHDTLSFGILIEIPDNERASSVLKDVLFMGYKHDQQVRFTPVSEADYQHWVAGQGKARHIVTLLTRKVTAEQLQRVSSITAKYGLNIDHIDRLSGRMPLDMPEEQGKGCIEFSVRGEPANTAALRAEFLSVAQELNVDIAFQRDSVYRRNRRLAVFDMDSTLIEAEVIDELAKAAGVGEQVSEITERAMRGELDFRASFKERLALLEGLSENVLADIGASLRLTEGAEVLFAELKRLGYKTAILSGGFSYFAKQLQAKLGIDYVFAVMDQRTWVLTLRTNYLLDRNRSLQLYVQPFLTRGRYTDARYLATPDTYDLRPYDLDAGRYDFNYGAFNLNLVYRWEYRSGSTIFLVWSHSQERYDWRGGSPDPQEWSNGFDAGFPFGTEPGNTLLAKLSYWFSV